MTTKAYRERYALIAQILSNIRNSGKEGASRTSVMYKSYLSYTQLKEYLSFMVEKGLVEDIPHQFSGNEKFVYKITGKGRRLLQISKEIESKVGLD